VQRTCCQIVDNMCKVVEDPAAVLPVMPKLEPLVKSATEKISDPDARGMAERALKTLKNAAEGAESNQVSDADCVAAFKVALGGKAKDGEELAYVAALAARATNMRQFDAEVWKVGVGILPPFNEVIETVRAKMETSSQVQEEIKVRRPRHYPRKRNMKWKTGSLS